MKKMWAISKTRPFRVVAVGVALFAFGATIAGTVYDDGGGQEAGPSREDILAVTDTEALSAARELLGFDGSTATVDGLLGNSAARSGFGETGLLLSAGERIQFDARVALGDAVRSSVGQAKGNSGYAGARLEHTGNGVFHFYLTSGAEGDALLSTIQGALSSDLEVRFHRVVHSEAALEGSMSQTWSLVSDQEMGAGGVHTVSVDVANNRVVVELDEDIEATTGPGLANRIRAGMGVIPVQVRYSEVPVDSSCDHTSCADPMAGGIVIRKGSLSGLRCTLGFMVLNGGDTQAISAGHCGYEETNNWYHSAYGSNAFGGEIKEGAYENDGIDAMIVGIPSGQGSNHVASCVGDSDQCVDILGYMDKDDIYIGMIVNFIGGVSGQTSGTVNNTSIEWTSPKCGCTQYGIRLNISGTQKGDSGGVYRRNNDAVAIHAAFSGNTAYAPTVDAILDVYGVSLRTS